MANQLFRKKKINAILPDGEGEIHSSESKLEKIVTIRDLTLFGIADVISWGTMSTIASTSFLGGSCFSWFLMIPAV